MNCWKQIVSGALQLSCQAQRISVIQAGHRVFDALLGKPSHDADRKHVLKILLPTAYEVLDLQDEWDYRRLLELLDHCNLPMHKAEVVTFGLASNNNEIVETATEWLSPTLENVSEILDSPTNAKQSTSETISSKWRRDGTLIHSEGNIEIDITDGTSWLTIKTTRDVAESLSKELLNSLNKIKVERLL